MRLTLDANILVYAFVRDPDRTPIARRIIEQSMAIDLVLTMQAVGEFINVTHRKYFASLPDALDAVYSWALTIPLIVTTPADLVAAARLSLHHRLQFWDSLILTVAAHAGVDVILTEDMQDGATIGGVRLLNPFNPANREALAAMLTPAPGTA